MSLRPRKSKHSARIAKICARLHHREYKDKVGRCLSGDWKLYVVTIHALEMLLPAVCHRRSEEGFDQVLLASCEVGLEDRSNGSNEEEGMYVLCLCE